MSIESLDDIPELRTMEEFRGHTWDDRYYVVAKYNEAAMAAGAAIRAEDETAIRMTERELDMWRDRVLKAEAIYRIAVRVTDEMR